MLYINLYIEKICILKKIENAMLYPTLGEMMLKQKRIRGFLPLFFIACLIFVQISLAVTQSAEASEDNEVANRPIETPKPSSSDVMKHVREWMSSPELMEKNAGKDTFIFIGKLIEAHHIEVLPPSSKGLKRVAYVKSELTFEISEVLKNVSTYVALDSTQKVIIDTKFCGEDFEIGRDYLIFMEPYLVSQKGADGRGLRIKRYAVECRRQWALDRKDQLRPAFFYKSERGSNDHQYN